MEFLLVHFGYAFLVLGLILEGDATLVAAMILASQTGRHYFDLRWVLGLALGVTVAGNELMYELGALGWMRGRLGSGRHYDTASRWLHSTRGGYLALLFSRFLWGFRLMIPFAAGLLHIRRRRFSLSNLIGAVIWVTVLAYFGVAIESLIVLLHDDLMRYQSHIAVGLFLLGILIGLATIPWQLIRRSLRRKRRHRPPARPASPQTIASVATRSSAPASRPAVPAKPPAVASAPRPVASSPRPAGSAPRPAAGHRPGQPRSPRPGGGLERPYIP